MDEFGTFQNALLSTNVANRRLVTVNGAQAGQDAELIKNPNATYWNGVDSRLQSAGVTRNQVEAVRLKEAVANESLGFPQDALRLQTDLADIVTILGDRFPELRLVYVSSRTYGGYAVTPLNPEPFAYESGFAVKWLIENRIKANTTQPWVGWGPYLWTDGLRGRRDGLIWTCDDVLSDGTHPSRSGRQKVADLLLQFFETDTTARSWFLANP